jgi:very-short-patch-repair endonuclease
MEKYFIKVIRFKNSEVEKNIYDVVERIENEIKRRIQSPPWGI